MSLVELHSHKQSDEISHVCMCVSLFALLQYLLLQDDETAKKHTFYFSGYAVDVEISERLPGVYFGIKAIGKKKKYFQRVISKVILRITQRWKYPFLDSSKIFAQDHGFLPSLIGKREYSLLSDGPNFLTLNTQRTSAAYISQMKKNKTFVGRLEQLLFGPLSTFNLGNNEQCKEIYLTEENISPVLEGKRVVINSLQELWDSSSEQKKQFILSVFDVHQDDIQLLNSRKIMFLTQPFVDDGVLTEQEYVQLLDLILSNYDENQLILKLHPRDNFNYSQYYPNIVIYKKKVNIQLLNLLGVQPNKVATICSTSINDFPESVDADWYGPHIHPSILNFMGNNVCPFRKCNQPVATH